MRVYDLARTLGLPARVVVDRLRADGEWVNSHLSTVPAPVAGRYLPDRPAPVRQQPAQPMHPVRSPTDPALSLFTSPPRPTGRRPGPRPITMQQPALDEYDDPVEDLRYSPEITTRDVALLLGVTQATVRQWVARGYISPVGKVGPSNLFNSSAVLAAHDEIQARRKATGGPRHEHRYGVDLRRIRPKHYDAVVDVGEAARLIDVSPSTIRSWIHRGQLVPLGSSRPRALRLRLGDVITAARSRKLASRSAGPRGRRLPRPATQHTTP